MDSPAQILNELIADDVKRKIWRLNELQCPEHGYQPRIICKGRTIYDLTVEFSGNWCCSMFRDIIKEREKIETIIREYSSKIGRVEENIRVNERNYRETEKTYNREIQKKDRFKGIREKIQTCDTAMNHLQSIMNKIMHEIREEIQNSTKNYFSNLISEKNFSNFRIDPNYELIIEQEGFNAITSLSAAETLCLGYSFMSVIIRKGEESPLDPHFILRIWPSRLRWPILNIKVGGVQGEEFFPPLLNNFRSNGLPNSIFPF